MKTVYVLAALLMSIQAYCQSGKPTAKDTAISHSRDKIYTVVDQMPQYPQGEKAMMHFIQSNIMYPDFERENDIQGRVVVGFTVNEDGSITDVAIKKGVSKGLDAEALRMVRLMPDFVPGRQLGRAVRVSFLLPILFRLSGEPSARSVQKQIDTLNKYTREGNPVSQYEKGLGYIEDKNYAAAKSYLELSALKHYPPALKQLAYIYEYGYGVTKDYTKALVYLQEAADSGHSGAQVELGYLIEMGYGTTADKTKAARWYKKAADQDNCIGLHNLALYYTNGWGGLPNDDMLAQKAYMRSAEQGYASSQYQIGYMYENGQGGLLTDSSKAVGWYVKSASQNNAKALVKLGDYYAGGLGGLPKNDSTAYSHYVRASFTGNSYAQFHIAQLYQSGKNGFPADTDKAFFWYDLAAKQHYANALNNYAWLCYLKKTNIDQGILYVKEALQNTPDNINRLDTYASLLFLKGDYKEADKQQRNAIDHGGGNKAGYLERYGDILIKENKKQEAIKYWKMAQDLPGHSKKLADKIAYAKYIE